MILSLLAIIFVVEYDLHTDLYVYLFSFFFTLKLNRNENHNKLKYRVLLSDIWLSENSFDQIYWQYKQDTSFVIGWPPATNYIADFKDQNIKDIWFNKLKE